MTRTYRRDKTTFTLDPRKINKKAFYNSLTYTKKKEKDFPVNDENSDIPDHSIRKNVLS